MTERPFEILFVCTGNICRSAMAHQYLLARLPPGAPVVVRSAGVHGLEGWPMDAPSAQALREIGIDPDRHVARRLTASMVSDADLILTATTDHRRSVLELDPAALGRTFTQKEFALLAAPAPGPGFHVASAADLRLRVAEIGTERTELIENSALNIADPYGASIRTARRCRDEIITVTDAAQHGLGLR